jgi:hypothetical protein
MTRAVYALLAFIASIHLLGEELGLFARAEGELSETEAQRRRTEGPATDWGLDMLQGAGWDTSELDSLTDEISANVLERARGLIDTLGPRGTEAFYLSARVLVIDAFCALAKGSAIVCTGSPMEVWRNSLAESLKQDYGVDPLVETPTQDPILAPARDLVRAWRVWASDTI